MSYTYKLSELKGVHTDVPHMPHYAVIVYNQEMSEAWLSRTHRNI